MNDPKNINKVRYNIVIWQTMVEKDDVFWKVPYPHHEKNANFVTVVQKTKGMQQ